MPLPAEPNGPGIVETLLSNPTVKSILRSAANTGVREITRSILGTGRRRR
jgi:hypothetical protein